MLGLFSRHDNDAGGQMRDADSAVGLVDVLTAGAASAHGVDADVVGLDVDVDLLGLGENGDGRSGCVDAAARLGRRNTLNAVDAGFKLQLGENALAGDGGDDLFVSAEIAFGDRNDFSFPAVQVGIAVVHAEEIGCEQGGLITAGTGADLDDGATLVGGVLRQQTEAHLLLQDRNSGLQRLELIAGHHRHLLVGAGVSGQRPEFLGLLFRSAQCVDRGNDGVEAGELLGELGVNSLTDTAVELGLDGLPALDQFFQFILRQCAHVGAGLGVSTPVITCPKGRGAVGRGASNPNRPQSAICPLKLSAMHGQLVSAARARVGRLDPGQPLAFGREQARKAVGSTAHVVGSRGREPPRHRLEDGRLRRDHAEHSQTDHGDDNGRLAEGRQYRGRHSPGRCRGRRIFPGGLVASRRRS